MIRLLEELSYNAWPALQTVCYDGWLLRFAGGYTRRANSVNAAYPSTLDLDEKIATCEAFYAQRGQRTVFKITPAVQPPDLDAALAARGYTQDALTAVQVLDDLAALAPPTRETVTVETALSDAWSAAFCALNNVDERHLPTMQRMLANIVPCAGYLALHHNGQVVALGLGVVERGCLGFYDIVTAPAYRRQGFGRQLMLHLCRWGRENGAQRAYLQVMLNNPPALRLYAGLGFREVYQYWYRMKDTAG